MTTFQVYGQPAAQGSKKGFVNKRTGQVNMVESSKKLRPWRDDVKNAALEHFTEPYDGPLKVDLVLYLARPKGHFGTGRNAGQLKGSAPIFPTARLDIDKGSRAVLDALRDGGAYRDDSQVMMLAASKQYADLRPPGADITITPLGE